MTTENVKVKKVTNNVDKKTNDLKIWLRRTERCKKRGINNTLKGRCEKCDDDVGCYQLSVRQKKWL